MTCKVLQLSNLRLQLIPDAVSLLLKANGKGQLENMFKQVETMFQITACSAPSSPTTKTYEITGISHLTLF